MTAPLLTLLLIGLVAPSPPASYAWLGGRHPTRVLEDAVAAPAGFTRARLAAGSFGAWLRRLPLHPEGHAVRLFDGSEKPNQGAHVAVIDLDVGDRDLQQCADAVMRLRAEYLWASGQRDRLGFHLTNGMWTPWRRWATGERVKVDGNSTSWVSGGPPDRSRAQFLRWLRGLIFVYSGSASLVRDTHPRGLDDLTPGDVLLQGGHPGHAVLILDLAQAADGRRRVLLGQSYMPAQDFHVLVNPRDPAGGPWYDPEALRRGLETPEWRPFHDTDLRYFKD